MSEEESALRAQQQALLLGLNHELRTPLTTIGTSVQLLADTTLDAHQRKLVDELQTSLARAEAVLAQLVDPAETRLGGTHVPKA